MVFIKRTHTDHVPIQEWYMLVVKFNGRLNLIWWSHHDKSLNWQFYFRCRFHVCLDLQRWQEGWLLTEEYTKCCTSTDVSADRELVLRYKGCNAVRSLIVLFLKFLCNHTGWGSKHNGNYGLLQLQWDQEVFCTATWHCQSPIIYCSLHTYLNPLLLLANFSQVAMYRLMTINKLLAITCLSQFHEMSFAEIFQWVSMPLLVRHYAPNDTDSYVSSKQLFL